jgi:hypothetical protein
MRGRKESRRSRERLAPNNARGPVTPAELGITANTAMASVALCPVRRSWNACAFIAAPRACVPATIAAAERVSWAQDAGSTNLFVRITSHKDGYVNIKELFRLLAPGVWNISTQATRIHAALPTPSSTLEGRNGRGPEPGEERQTVCS